MEEMLRRSKSYCEVSLALKNIEKDEKDFGNNITAEVKKPEPPKAVRDLNSDHVLIKLM